MCQRGSKANFFRRGFTRISRIPGSKAEANHKGHEGCTYRDTKNQLGWCPWCDLCVLCGSLFAHCTRLNCYDNFGVRVRQRRAASNTKGMDKTHFFFERYGLTKEDIERYL